MISPPTMLDIAWVVICSSMVMFMQAGFCLLESGFSRAKNSINVALKNLVDFCAAGVSFFLIGFGIMYGSSPSGLIGLRWPLATADVDPWTLSFFLFQFVFCGTATTIVSGAVAERMRFRAYVIISFVVSGLMYPIFGHWAWGGAAGFGDQGWLASIGFIDFAGSTVVHSVGGWISLAAVIILGPRMGRFDRSNQIMHGHNLTLAVMGVMILWFGWFGFNGGSTLAMSQQVPLILVNTNLAPAAGGVAAMLLSTILRRRIDVSYVLLGVVAGLVGITASCHLVDPWESLVIGAIAGVLCILASELLVIKKIDDVVGAWPTHAVAGIWGTLAVALFGNVEAFGTGMSRFEQFQIQLAGAIICAAWSFGVGFIVLRIINAFCPFRVTAEDEEAGLNVSEHNATTELIDLLSDMNQQRISGDFARPVRVEPYTEVGQIANQYNAVLSRVKTEIDRRDEVAQALRQAEQRYRRIFEDAVEGIFQTTPAGKYLIANPSLARIYGYDSPVQLIDSVRDISSQLYVDPTRRDEFRRQIDRDGSIAGFESEIKRKDGSHCWISESARIVRDDVGNVLYYEGTVEDISERKRSRDMEKEVEVAHQASQAKSNFLAHVSHEIRTPLNGIIGMLDLLGQSSLSDSQANYVRVARSSSKLLLSVINDVLDFSKIEAGKLETSPHDFDIVRLVEETIESFGPTAEKKGIALTYSLPSRMVSRWHADSDRLKQIATNLIGNALKFTEKGSVSLRVECEHEDTSGALFRFTVIDTGIGIPPDRVRRLFLPFSQVDASTTRRYGGTGLGLAISRKLAELLGGQLGVQSTEGVGSEFFWTARLERAQSHLGQSREIPDILRRARVVVVSPLSTDREIVPTYLRQWGITCQTAPTIEEATSTIRSSVARREPVDVVIADGDLLGLEPENVLDRWKSTPAASSPRILSLVSLGDVASTSQRPARGIAGFVTRPILQSRLFDAIIASVGHRPTGDYGVSRIEESVKDSRSAPISHGHSSVQPRVLVAEDNEVNQFVIKELLERQGIEVEVVGSGEHAVDMIERRSFDLVLMDCQMPNMDGFEATRAIRRHEAKQQRKATPIVALTASAVRGDRERCLDAGMNDYITKPIDQHRLKEILDRYLRAVDTKRDVSSAVTVSATDHGVVIDPIDIAGLLRRCSGDQDFACRLLTKFVDRLGRELDRLSTGVTNHDMEDLASLGHSLLGSASTVTAHPLAQAASQLEAGARLKQHAVVSEAADLLRSEIERLQAQVDQLMVQIEQHSSLHEKEGSIA
jgi:ammonium transporter, Amt family